MPLRRSFSIEPGTRSLRTMTTAKSAAPSGRASMEGTAFIPATSAARGLTGMKRPSAPQRFP